jgi:hypothetical protein
MSCTPTHKLLVLTREMNNGRNLTVLKLNEADFIEYEREKYQRDILVFSIVIFE